MVNNVIIKLIFQGVEIVKFKLVTNVGEYLLFVIYRLFVGMEFWRLMRNVMMETILIKTVAVTIALFKLATLVMVIQVENPLVQKLELYVEMVYLNLLLKNVIMEDNLVVGLVLLRNLGVVSRFLVLLLLVRQIML